MSIPSLISSIAGMAGIVVNRYEPVHGGNINQCFCLHSTGKKYFLKLNNAARFPEMFAKEAVGLLALRNGSTLAVPGVVAQGVVENTQWLLLDWFEKGVATDAISRNFGISLAHMHLPLQNGFGWPADNYIGSLQQLNSAAGNWPDFFTQCRIMPLVKRLVDQGKFSKNDSIQAEKLCKNAGRIFPDEKPALLHGDLWSGNYMVTTNREVAIFDPAVYCGHREMDIGLTKLFGGFQEFFYDAYNDAYPMETGWEDRLPLVQLYPVLVHAVLFGGQYCSNAKQIIALFA